MSSTSIFLQKSSKVLLPKPTRKTIRADVATFNVNLESLGFCMSKDLMLSMSSLSVDELTSLSKQIISTLKEMVGAHRKYTPMYPNFPQQVMEMSEAELYCNAILHYIGSYVEDVFKIPARYLPKYTKLKREELPDEDICLKAINLGSQEEFDAIFTNLVGSNGSLSAFDKDIVTWFVKNKSVQSLIPDSIPQKENLSYLVSIALTCKKQAVIEELINKIKTATDVLRVD